MDPAYLFGLMAGGLHDSCKIYQAVFPHIAAKNLLVLDEQAFQAQRLAYVELGYRKRSYGDIVFNGKTTYPVEPVPRSV